MSVWGFTLGSLGARSLVLGSFLSVCGYWLLLLLTRLLGLSWGSATELANSQISEELFEFGSISLVLLNLLA